MVIENNLCSSYFVYSPSSGSVGGREGLGVLDEKAGSQGSGIALGELQAFLRPSARHVVEVQQEKSVMRQGDQEGSPDA